MIGSGGLLPNTAFGTNQEAGPRSRGSYDSAGCVKMTPYNQRESMLARLAERVVVSLDRGAVLGEAGANMNQNVKSTMPQKRTTGLTVPGLELLGGIQSRFNRRSALSGRENESGGHVLANTLLRCRSYELPHSKNQFWVIITKRGTNPRRTTSLFNAIHLAPHSHIRPRPSPTTPNLSQRGAPAWLPQ